MLVRKNWTIGLVAAVAIVALSACLPPPKGWVVTAVTGQDEPRVCNSSGDGGPVGDAYLGGTPLALEFDAAGSLYVAEGARIRKIDTSGIITTVAGTGVTGYSGDGGPATAAQIGGVRAMALDAEGNLYLADTANQRVRVVLGGEGRFAGHILTIAGTGVEGFSGDGGQATSAEFDGPFGLAVDAAGNLYISDVNNDRVRKVDTAGTITTVAGNGSFGPGPGPAPGDGGPADATGIGGIYGLDVDAAGNLYLMQGGTSNGRVRIVTTDGIIGTLVGGGDDEYPGGSPTDYRLQFSFGVAVDASGGVFFTNAARCMVLTMERTGGSIGGQILDSAGSAVVGATVELYDAADPTTPIDTRITGSGGIYGFSLPPGEYKLRVTVLDAGGDPVIQSWYANAADGASATTITIAPHDQPRVDVTLDDLTLG